jgi:predicted enzyme related to lactoylglutathione lyase
VGFGIKVPITMLQPQKIWITLADFDGVTLKQFYQDLFGQAPTLEIPNVYAEFDLPGLRLGLFKPKLDHHAEFQASNSGGMSLCLQVESLETAIAHFRKLGYPPQEKIQPTSHGRELYVYDPYGNRLILYEPQSDR